MIDIVHVVTTLGPTDEPGLVVDAVAAYQSAPHRPYLTDNPIRDALREAWQREAERILADAKARTPYRRNPR